MSKTKLAVAMMAALAANYSPFFMRPVHAQTVGQPPADNATTASQQQAAKRLDAVTVTGSLIPQVDIETATPITTITAQDIKARGFTSVADALQQSSFATGGTQGAQSGGGFTPGAQTLSMFGLSPSYVKYLIDGRPMSDFPALYNGSDTFNSISGIPVEMIDHIDVLPGGQSSLYGSDAIAGVINIVLRKKIDRASIDVRYGFYQDGGGPSRRVTFADGFNAGRFNLMYGVQYQKDDAMWGYDRSLTRQFTRHGTTPATASRDILVSSATATSNGYYFDEIGASCANVTGLFNGTEGERTRANSGRYCGSFDSPGYRTLSNNSESAQVYTHATFDLNPTTKLYSDLLYNYDETRYATGSGYTFWSTSDYGKYYDPDLADLVTIQRAFAPEEIGQGGYKAIQNKQTTNAYRFTLGGKGTFGESNWDYDLAATHTEQKLINRQFSRFTDAINGYFQSHVLGEQQGVDPIYGLYPVFAPNYAALYSPVAPADFAAFTGYTTTHAKTWDNMLRGQVTNASLFSMPGGDAGIALVAEGAGQGWSYAPDARSLDGSVWGRSDVQGAGHRSRYASTVELRLPVASMLTFDLSGRYDNYKVNNQHIGKATYNIGVELRPLDTLLLRGRYGTAFKAPTLSDQFQGTSGYYSYVTDYYNCEKLGYTGGAVADCPSRFGNVQFKGTQSGNTGLKPITATVWSYGAVWSPADRLSFSADYYHYNITNEVNQQSADQLSRDNARCLVGERDAGSPTCIVALSQVTRDAQGDITAIYTPKVNVSTEVVNAVTADANYSQPMAGYGTMFFKLSYSDVLTHQYRAYPGDPITDIIRDPTRTSGDFKSRVNGSITWVDSARRWSTTIYGTRYGATPNYLASTYGYDQPGAGRLAPWILFNASVSYKPTPDWVLSLNVNNVANKMPPRDTSYPGTEGQPYNVMLYNPYGRAYYVEAKYSF